MPTITMFAIERAIEQAHTISDDWQAELLEILLLPKVYRIWHKLNTRYPDATITRHPGVKVTGTREDNLARCDAKTWRICAGYTFDYGVHGYTWNSVRDDYYGHSPSTTWDGIRRETACGFVEALRMAYYNLAQGKIVSCFAAQCLCEYGITIKEHNYDCA